LNVSIAGILSLSVLRIRNFSNPKVIPMNPNAAPSAVRHESQSAMETVAMVMAMIAMVTEPLAKCSLRYALNVVKKLKCHLNHVKADRCIAVIVTVKSN
jgi:hypothetical protein